MMASLNVLVVQNDAFVGALIAEKLKEWLPSADVRVCTKGSEVKPILSNEMDVDLLITAHKLDGMNGLEVLDMMRSSFISVKTIMYTCDGSVESEAENKGAAFLFKKPGKHSLDELLDLVKKILL